MGLMRRAWPPELNRPDERIDRAFRDFITGGTLFDRFFEGSNQMHIEEYVEDGTCVVRAELPGIDPDKDIDISVVGDVVRLRARREERKEEELPSGYHSEFRYGSFERDIRLPEGASLDDVKAVYKDGILEVRIPVAAPSAPTPTRVPIEHA